MSAASSPFRQSGDSRLAATCRSGFREQIDGIGWPRATLYIDTQDTRDDAVFRGPVGLQAPVFRQESEGGIRRRMRKQPGGESGLRCCLGMESSVRATGMHGVRFDGPHHGLGNGGCCEVGEPAGVLFDTAACNDQHEYDDRSVRETDRGSYRAASVQSPPTFERLTTLEHALSRA